jgi:5-methylcytosine-specific restriction endonuclease McrA
MMREAPERDLIRFAEKVLALLDQGSFTATYKYAVLLGLMDLCMEQVSRSGQPPTSLTTRQLAEKTIELYWPHTVRYPISETVLRQNQGRGDSQAAIVSAIAKFRHRTSFESLARCRARHRAAFERLVRSVEWKLIEMPLPRVQIVGDREDRFIYEIGWTRDGLLASQRAFRREVSAYQRGERSEFDNAIRLKPSAAHALLALNSLLRPLIHTHWTAKVAQINRLEESRLGRFLFDPEREPTAAVRDGLAEIQAGRCFYCRSGLRSDFEVDHFVPWSRYRDNRLDNLVPAHPRCNRAKLDFLAEQAHIERWRERNDDGRLALLAKEQAWERYSDGTLGVARAIYFGLPDGTPLWVEGDRFAESSHGVLRQVLS